MSDSVNKPYHYNTGNIECIDAIKNSMSLVEFKGYLKGNAIKYLWRYDKKHQTRQGRAEDLKKAVWYIEKLYEVINNE
ncbi:DUF3310 domain-containing protein [Hyphomonas sp.]|uniref:DUF3310 domain-containing protein n=1 Tax=Hyphomonas sp. TaxID=87 RepID=UPI000C9747FA|nr:DUF3310 domain-containing protein [Hyphomonas sp.]MAL42885.1 hypothetical protein [Hyphomonas sp.]